MTPDAADPTYQRIWATVDCVPPGRVATYGQIAAEAGLPDGFDLDLVGVRYPDRQNGTADHHDHLRRAPDEAAEPELHGEEGDLVHVKVRTELVGEQLAP